jgi:putative ABC transport system permease protein
MSDLRFALRALRRSPGFTAAAVLTLALGIGAATAVFALADTMLLRPFDLPAPERLVTLYASSAENPYRSFVYSDYVDVRDRTDAFDGVAAHVETDVSLVGAGAAVRVHGELVSGNYFAVLGVESAAGRLLVEADDEPGSGAVVIAAGLAARLFGGATAAVGRTVRINDHPYTVVGVAPSRFRGVRLTNAAELWMPLTAWDRLATGFFANFDAVDYAAQRGRQRIGLWQVTARLRPDVSLPQARAQVATVADGLALEFPETNTDLRFSVLPATAAAVPPAHRDASRAFLALLAGTVMLTLIIACANVANLLLARAIDRRAEVGMRMALGAGRRRIAGQFVMESTLVALAGAAAGLLIAHGAVLLLGAYRLPGGIPVSALGVELDLRLAAVAAGIAALSAGAFGTAPALLASRTAPAAAMRGSGARGASGGTRLRSALVSLQVALCFVLLIGAGLFIRSVQAVLSEDLGFDPRGVLTMSVNLGEQRYEPIQAEHFFDALLREVAAVPGVDAAGVTSVPFGSRGIGVSAVWAFDRGEDADLGRVALTRASPGYLAAAGMRLLAGRAFTTADNTDAPDVAVVSQSFARRVWPGEEAVGRRFNFSGPSGSPLTVIGVVADAMHESVGRGDVLQVLLPLRQHAEAAAGDPMTLYVRTSGRPGGVVEPVRDVIRRLDPSLPVFDVMALNERIAGTIGTQRLGRILLVLLGLAATAVALVGVYGVTAYAATRRTREFGIRVALGAPPGAVGREVLRGAVGPVLAGLAAGGSLGLLTGRFLAGFLYGVTPRDLPTWLAAGILLAVATLVASWLPARRAARIDPMEALRHE